MKNPPCQAEERTVQRNSTQEIVSYQHTCTYYQQIRPRALAKHLRRIIHNQNR